MEPKKADVKIEVKFEDLQDEFTVPSSYSLEDIISKFNDRKNSNVDKFKIKLQITSDSMEATVE